MGKPSISMEITIAMMAMLVITRGEVMELRRHQE